MTMIATLKRRLRGLLGIDAIEAQLGNLHAHLDAQAVLLGRLSAACQSEQSMQRLSDWEFKVSSQWGEDGVIQALIKRVDISRLVFVEFGVEDYTEANTRFLLQNDNWSGLVMDGSAAHIESIRRSELYWRYSLKAEQAFVTRENVNDLLRSGGLSGEVGLLSIDIDGNDYWVWQAIEAVVPDIVIVEYNARFGPTASVTVPYRADFDRRKAHFSMIYYGASLPALCKLGETKDMAFVGCNSAGNNAFFVRRDKLPPDLRALRPDEAFVAGKFRESRDELGRLAFLSPEQEQALLRTLPVVEV